MSLYTLDPLQDSRWDELVARHPQASIFHTTGWLRALHDTYRYRPLVLTTSSPGGPLTNGLPFCEVNSCLTGRRLVSVPFSDHCAVLSESDAQTATLLSAITRQAHSPGYKYLELRLPADTPAGSADWHESTAFTLHTLNLSDDSDTLLQRTHASSVRRRIRKAAKTGLVCREGETTALLATFYRLQVSTRRKHGLPPQPWQWFANLGRHLAGQLRVFVVYHDDQPLAAQVTLLHRDTCYHKYGASDPGRLSSGASPVGLWHAILHAKADGARYFDLGRSALHNTGLIEHKDRWGAQRTNLQYYRRPAVNAGYGTPGSSSITGRFFRALPEPVLVAAGRLLYRHIG